MAASLAISGCAGSGDAASTAAKHEPETIKESPDKYTWYVKDYVGMNAASAGYTSMDGFRRDEYGKSNLKLVYVATTGEFLDPEDEDQLKEYVVVGQNLQPNTEIKFTYSLDENGEEYENLVSDRSYEEIVLSVAKIGQTGDEPSQLTEIEPSLDKHTQYVRDYVGRNLAACGYVSVAGYLTDSYGHAYITFDIVTDDGSYVDVEDEEALMQYVVTGQSVDPNTEISLTYSLDENGEEYENLVSDKSLDSITLNVTKLEE